MNIWAMIAACGNVTIRDIRKPRPGKDMRLFDGSVADVAAIRIAVLGTDCAIGKRTTATVLTNALNAAGISTVLIGTGQTGLMQGAKYGVAMDAVPPQFCCGELERVILAASRDALIEAFADTRVIGVTINHEDMTEADLDATITRCRRDLVLPVSDALARPAGDLVAMVLAACPGLRENRVLAAQ